MHPNAMHQSREIGDYRLNLIFHGQSPIVMIYEVISETEFFWEIAGNMDLEAITAEASGS